MIFRWKNIWSRFCSSTPEKTCGEKLNKAVGYHPPILRHIISVELSFWKEAFVAKYTASSALFVLFTSLEIMQQRPILREEILFENTMSSISFNLLAKFLGTLVKAGFCVFMGTIWIEKFFLKKCFFIVFRHWMKNFSQSVKRFPASLSKLHSTCPKDLFQQHFLGKKLFSTIVVKWAQNSRLFVEFFSTVLSKLFSRSLGNTLRAKRIFANRFLLFSSILDNQRSIFGFLAETFFRGCQTSFLPDS